MRFFSRNKKEILSDEELLKRLQETGESTYFEQLYERYIPMIYGLCLKYLQNAERSQDAVMDIYESLISKAAGYEITIFKNWLYSVVKNHCFHVLRQNKKEITVDFDSNLMESEDIITLLDDERANDDREAALNKCIEQLPEPQRISVCKFFLEDKSYSDIVDETGYHLKSVKSYIQNGKRNLKICIEKNLTE